jgi:hypothetical protein
MFGKHLNRHHSRRPTLRLEGWNGRIRRLRRAMRKIKGSAAQYTAPDVTARVVTHADEATFERAHAANCGIAIRGEEEAASVQVELASARADLAAGTDEAKDLQVKRSEADGRRRNFDGKVEEAGLAHELVASSPWLTMLIMFVAIVFETIALAVPMQLLGAVDLGGATTAALLLGFGYAVLLACLGKGVGHRLKYRSRWHVLEVELEGVTKEEGRSPSVNMLIEDRVIAVALAAAGFALLAASVIREAAIKILASAGESQVAVSWPIFLALTLALFVAVAAIAYWKASPVAEVHARLEAPVKAYDQLIATKRRECYQAAARVAGHEIKLQAIEARNENDQLAQLHLAAEEICYRRAANPHVYGVAIDPTHVQNVITSPKNYIRRLRVPAIGDLLAPRIEAAKRDITPPTDPA